MTSNWIRRVLLVGNYSAGPRFPAGPSGLLVRLDADEISGLADTDPVTTWLDVSGNSNDATQSTAGARPLYRINQTPSGRPAVLPDGTQWMDLTGLTSTAGSYTVFAVTKVAPGAYRLFDSHAGRLILGNSTSGGLIDLACYDGTWRYLGAQIDEWQILAWRCDGTGNTVELFKNAEKLGESAYASTNIGGDTALFAADNGGSARWQRPAADFVMYEGALSDADMMTLFRYFSEKHSIDLSDYDLETYQTAYHVDSVNGNDGNGGESVGDAFLTLSQAESVVTAATIIHVYAPEATPLRELVTWNTNQSGVVKAERSGDWHAFGSVQYTDGWSDEGSGVYSRADPGTTTDNGLVTVTTLTDGDGFYQVLEQSTGSPTTPGAGAFGVDSGTLYVHLPGDADPNSHTVEVPIRDNVLAFSGGGNAVVRDAVLRYAKAKALSCGSKALRGISCTLQYSESGIGTSSVSAGVRLDECTAQRNSNDGFNHKNGTLTLVGCEGSYNLDEGASPHQSAVLNVTGGSYHHNRSGGITGIDSAVMNLSGVECHHNFVDGAVAGEAAITYKAAGMSGVCASCYCHDNTGPGFLCVAGVTLALTNLRSGVAEGNTDADSNGCGA